MPPATAASNPSITRLRRASSNSSGPWWASSRLEAADQLDDDLDGRIVDGLARVGGEGQARQVDPVARSGEVRVGHAPEGEAAPRALGHLRAVALEDLGHAAADRAQT
jgi:hypothetical protein